MNKKYIEENVTINSEYSLKGTLTIPNSGKDEYPAVLLVAGSGEVDRNGNAAKMKFDLNIYSQLADIITDLGYITLRYDKRGVGESQGEFLTTGMWDLVDDVRANYDFLKSHPKVDSSNIIMLGHSEGCTLVTAAYAKSPEARALVMLAGAAETISEALKRQRFIAFSELMYSKGIKGALFRLLKIDQKGEKQAQKLMKKISNSDKDVMSYNFTKLNAKWQREHFKYNVLEDLKKVDCPVLAITGSKDFQANPEKLSRLKDLVKGENQSYVIENMDHILREYTGDISALNFKNQYKAESSMPIHGELTERLNDWFTRMR